jgi:Asp-tRNA(Asn)/Glu-tRNA(Gln) amidotransferase A subunit family amidase
MDYFTVIANSIGTCNLTVPLFESEEAKTKYLNFPSSVRLMGFYGEDFHLLRIGQRIEKILELNGMSAK